MGSSKGFKASSFLGEYDWSFLCTPRVTFTEQRALAPFYGRDEKISPFLAVIMGLQHALAMVGGIVTPPLILSGSAGFSTNEQAYLVSAALIVSAVASCIQIYQFKVPFTRLVVGSGLLSVMGVTFSFLPIAQQTIATLGRCTCGGAACTPGGTCAACTEPVEGNCLTGQEAYGKVLGTLLVCCWVQVILSLSSPKLLRRIFPPVVTGVAIMLIGISLVGTGFQYWGGGAYCASQVLTSKVPCTGNGEVILPFGDRHYLGLGFVVFCTLVAVELFGSPFMRNIQVIIGLLVGMIVASATTATVCFDGTCESRRYVTSEKISEADWITFLWVHTYPLKIYGPAILPMLFAFVVTSMECIGDVTATTEASGLPPYGAEFERSVQGAILADGLNSFWAALATIVPVTTYAQNNGVISLSRCASRRAGFACCAWLFIFGVIAKFSAIILTIPDCVLGGMTTFLFTSVVASGIHVLHLKEGMTRRNRFIVTMSLGLGLGVNLIPAWVNISGQEEFPSQGNFWPIRDDWSSAYKGFRDALILLLSNGFSVGGFTALLLNLLLPFDKELEANDSHFLKDDLLDDREVGIKPVTTAAPVEEMK